MTPIMYATLEEAAALVRDGMTLALGGMTIYRRPVAFVRALLRRDPHPRDLTLLCFTAGFESDLLVGAGCVRAVRSVYFGLEAFGFAPMFTERANRGELTILVEGDRRLFNQYGVMLVNKTRHAHVKDKDGQAFVDWLVSPEGQKAIADYKINGQQLFFPNAGQSGV